MGLDIRAQCLACAWREGCAKKYTAKETALHCPDFCRDLSLPADDAGEGPIPRHKRLEDVFGS